MHGGASRTSSSVADGAPNWMFSRTVPAQKSTRGSSPCGEKHPTAFARSKCDEGCECIWRTRCKRAPTWEDGSVALCDPADLRPAFRPAGGGGGRVVSSGGVSSGARGLLDRRRRRISRRRQIRMRGGAEGGAAPEVVFCDVLHVAAGDEDGALRRREEAHAELEERALAAAARPCVRGASRC